MGIAVGIAVASAAAVVTAHSGGRAAVAATVMFPLWLRPQCHGPPWLPAVFAVARRCEHRG